MSIHHQRTRRTLDSWRAVGILATLIGVAWYVPRSAAQDASKAAAKPAETKAATAAPKAEAKAPAAAPKAEPKAAAAPASEPKTAPGKAAPAAKPAAKEPAAEEPAAAEPTPPPRPKTYKQDASDDELQKAAERFKKERTRGNVQKGLRAQAFAAGEEAQFDAYYTEYALPRWTSPANLTSLIDYRKELRGDFLNGKSGPPYDRLLRLTLDYMTKLIGPEYHPAVRYNATVVLGELNVQELAPGARGLVQPLPAALKILVDAVKNTDSDAVRVAALIGLARHAGLVAAERQARPGAQDPPAWESQIVPMLLDVAKSPPPPGRSPDGHGWIRALAIEVLAALRSLGPNGSVVTTLAAIVADKAAPMMTRCAAARALGTFDYKGFTAQSPSQLAVPLGQLAVEACSAQLRKARTATAPTGKSAAGGGMRPGMGSMMPGMPGMGRMSMPSMPGMPGMGSSPYGGAPGAKEPEDEETAERVLRLRRSLKYYLNVARLGLNGPSDGQIAGIRLFAKTAKNLPDDKDRLAADPDYRFVDSILKSVQDQIRILDKDEEEYRVLSQNLSTARTKLQDLLKGGPQAPPPAQDKGAAKSAPAKK